MTQTRKAARNGRSSHQGTVVRRLRTLSLYAICGLDRDAMDLLKVVTNPGSRLYNQVIDKSWRTLLLHDFLKNNQHKYILNKI